MRLFRNDGPRRIALWAERSLWALGLLLLGYWGYSQAAMRIEQSRLEESLFGDGDETRAPASSEDDALAAELETATKATVAPVLEPGTALALIEIPRLDVRAMVVDGRLFRVRVDGHGIEVEERADAGAVMAAVREVHRRLAAGDAPPERPLADLHEALLGGAWLAARVGLPAMMGQGLLGAGWLLLTIAAGFLLYTRALAAMGFPGAGELLGLPGKLLRRLRRR